MKQSSERLDLDMKIVVGSKQPSTPWSGTSVLAHLCRKLELNELIGRVKLGKKSAKRLQLDQAVESFIPSSALGGQSNEYAQHLRDDTGLLGKLTYQSLGLETARQWLDRFHDQAPMANELQSSFVPLHSMALAGPRQMNKPII